MKDLKSEALNGENNKRLDSVTCTHRETEEARSNISKEMPHSHVSIPSESSVINNKEWVDNGSKL